MPRHEGMAPAAFGVSGELAAAAPLVSVAWKPSFVGHGRNDVGPFDGLGLGLKPGAAEAAAQGSEKGPCAEQLQKLPAG